MSVNSFKGLATHLTLTGTARVPSGAKLDVESGGELEISSGATFDCDADMTMGGDVDLSATSNISLGGIDVLLGAGVGSAAAAANATLFGLGTSAAPIATATANKNALEFRSKSTATTGDHRTIYARCDIGGAGGAGEALRGNTVLTAAAGGTVNGVHGSVSVGSGGSVAGQACGVRSNFLVPNSALSGGTIYGCMAEIYSEGASSSVAGTTKHAILGIVASGNATGAATVDTAISIDGSDGSGEMIYDHVITTPGSAGGSVKCKFNDAVGYIYWWDTEGAT
jgi:hypothetical protein